MRVLHATPSVGDTFGGITKSLQALGRVEARLGTAATLVTLDRPEQGGAMRSELEQWYDVRSLPAGPVAGRYHGGRRVSAGLRALVPQHDLVVFHSVFDFVSLVGHRVARAAGVPYLLWAHGCLDPYDLVKHARAKRALAPLWRSLISGASALLCTTRLEADRLHTFGVPDTARRVLPLPYELAREPGDGAAARRRLGLATDARVVLFLGRIDPKKGLPLLLEGFDRAATPGDVLVVAGSGEEAYQRAVRAHAARLRDPGRVLFPGWIRGREKADLLAAADLFVLVSDNENFGHAVAEAMAAGVPTLLSREVYLAEELEPLGAAAVCDRTPCAVADRLRSLLDDHAGRARIAEAGRDFVVTRLAPDVVADRYAAILAEAIG